MQPGSDTRAMRQHGGTGMVVAVIVGVLTLAGLIAWLLLDNPDRPQREPAEVVPTDASAVFTFYPGRLVNKAGLPDLIRENLDQLGGLALMVEPDQLGVLADFTRLGIRNDLPVHLFLQPGNNGPRAGLVLPLISREAFETGMRDNLPGDFGDDILNQMTEERGLRGIFKNKLPFVFAYDHHTLVLLFEESGPDPEQSSTLGTMLHTLFDQEKGLAAAEASFAKYLEANHDLGYWVKLDALPQLLDKSTRRDLEKLGAPLRGITTLGLRFEPGQATLDLTLTGSQDLPFRPVDPKLLKAIPRDYVLTLASGLDLKAIGEQVTNALGENGGLIEQLGDEVPMDKLREIIQNLTRGEDINLDEQFTGDMAIALTGFDMQKVPLLNVRLPKLRLVGSFKTKAKADTGKLVEQFKLAEPLGLEAFAREDIIHLASPDLRAPLEQNGTVPEPIAGPARDQLANPSAAMILNFTQLTKVLEKFPSTHQAAAAIAPLETLDATLRTAAGTHRATLRITLRNKKTNALGQLIKMSINPAQPDGEEPAPEKAEQ